LSLAGIALPLLAQGATAPASSPVAAPSNSMLDFIAAGGTIGYLIIVLSLVGLTMVVIHFIQIRRDALAPPAIVDELDRLLAQRQVGRALEFCRDPANACFLTHVMNAGLTRYTRSAFGALELKSALEEAGQERVARMIRSTDGLALLATIAPMLGLLGTVVGINSAFATISTAESMSRSNELASAISMALITTIMGLVLAIPAMAAATFFRNRIDALAASVGSTVAALSLHLEQESGLAPAAAPQQPATPAPPAAGGPATPRPTPPVAAQP
jgi:biopolymer transport protein ExbB